MPLTTFEQVFMTGLLAVLAGNLLTLAFFGGWRSYLRGRRESGAPLWSIYAVALSSLLAVLAVVVIVRAGLVETVPGITAVLPPVEP